MAQITIAINDALVPRVRAAFRVILNNPTAGVPEIKAYLQAEIKRIVKLAEADAAVATARTAAEESVDTGIVLT